VQSSIGSLFTIAGVVEFEDHIKIEVLHEESGPGCPTLGALNHPYKILEIDSRKTVTIEEAFELQDCTS